MVCCCGVSESAQAEWVVLKGHRGECTQFLPEVCDSTTAIRLFTTKRLLRFGKHRKRKKKLQKAQQTVVLFKQSSNSPRSSIDL
jgi:hypothetical protein